MRKANLISFGRTLPGSLDLPITLFLPFSLAALPCTLPRRCPPPPSVTRLFSPPLLSPRGPKLGTPLSLSSLLPSAAPPCPSPLTSSHMGSSCGRRGATRSRGGPVSNSRRRRSRTPAGPRDGNCGGPLRSCNFWQRSPSSLLRGGQLPTTTPFLHSLPVPPSVFACEKRGWLLMVVVS